MCRMLAAIKDNVKRQDYVDAMHSDFSTSTPVTRINSQLALMASLQEYFEYSQSLLCGIPSIIMDGPEKDWKKLGEQ